jgi:hypothetical protein
MRRLLAVTGAMVVLLGVGVASASSLIVRGGGLMVLTSLVEPPEPPPPGQEGTSIEASKTAEGFWVSDAPDAPLAGVRGQICVTNTGERATEGLVIVDQVQYKTGSGQFEDLVDAAQLIAPADPLPPAGSACYEYEISFPPIDGAQYRNVAHVTITNHAGWLPGGQNCNGPEPCSFGPEPKADFALPALPPVLLDLPTETATPEATATEAPTPTDTEVPPPQPPL